MKYLKKMKNGNLRLQYFKFTEIPYLENYSRCKSLIIKDFLEIYCTSWHEMFLKIANTLQELMPKDIPYLLVVNSDVRNKRLFLEEYKSGYVSTNYNLYIKDYSTANNVVWAISKLLRVYGFDLNECFFVVQTAPKYMDDKEQIIKEEKIKFCQFMKANFIESNRLYNKCLEIIDELNFCLNRFSNTSYNNLYLLDIADFTKYSSWAVLRQLERPDNNFSKRELLKAVDWLDCARFYGLDILNDKYIPGDGFYIDENSQIISVKLRNYNKTYME